MSRTVVGQWPGERPELPERGEALCRADDLKGLLQRLSEQIADADRRHGESLREMQTRLLRLGDQSEQVKAALPEGKAAAFERIDEGMAELAERLADGARGKPATTPMHDHSEATASLAPPDVFARRDMPAGTPAPFRLSPASPSPAPSLAPSMSDRAEVPALASALAAVTAAPAVAAAAAAAPAASVAVPEPVAPAIAVAPIPAQRDPDAGFRHYPDEPWDAHSAAALARLYESGEPGLPPRLRPDETPALGVAPAIALPPVAIAPALALTPATATTATAAPAAEAAPAPAVADAVAATPDAAARAPVAARAAPEIERAWLEEKLADVAERVHASLVQLKPESSFLALGERFDQFEQRFTSVLDDVATRSDVEGLRLVEAHISELSSQLVQAQTQLARLDAIEAQFAELRDKLSDEQILNLFGGLVPTEQDLKRFAEDAAGKVADRVIAQMPAPAAPVIPPPDGRTLAQVESMHSLLASFIDERRRGEASTADALETMQLAMQQVLDRVDALEQMRVASLAQAPAPQAAPPQPTLHLPAQPPLDTRVVAAPPPSSPEPQRAAARPDAKAALATEIRTFAEEAKAAARSAGNAQAAPRTARPDATRPASTDDLVTRPAASAGPAVAAAAAQPAGPAAAKAAAGQPVGASGESFDRARFVALARQAAEKAQGGERAVPAAQAEAPAERAAAKKSVTDRLLGAASEGAAKSSVRPGMLLVASVAFLVLAGAMFVLPKLRGAAPARPSQTIEAPAAQRPVQAAPAESQEPLQQKPRVLKGEPSRSAPAIDDEDARPKLQNFAPQGPGRPAERRADSALPEAQVTLAHVAPEQAVPPSAAPAGAPAGLGIAMTAPTRNPTIDEVMRARQRAHLATLSERTAQNAAANAAVPASAAPADVAGDAPAPAPEARDNQPIEMPPALVGPSSLRVAAQRGDASAQFEVAARFAEGKGIKQDFEQAFVWYQRAAAQGLAQAQYRLATLYERGLGVKADPARARVWYQRAADQGNLKAMHNLAVLSAGRDQAQPDYPTAVQWFTRAAEHGLADSQFNLGVLSETGLGVARDPITALKWYILAANSGDREAVRRRDAIKAKLDAIAVKEAEDAVAEWRAKASDRMANDPRAAGEAWKRRTGEARQ